VIRAWRAANRIAPPLPFARAVLDRERVPLRDTSSVGYMATQRIFVSGRVQGVGFRDWVVRTAQRTGLTGWVRNMRDGRVEILVSGEEEAVARLVEGCGEGSPLARVDHVEAFPAEGEKQAKGFTKRFTA
jgi:acylphosphatase